ncbi:MAG: redoxin domain-containing protein [Aeropyrum sp.]|nr:redoxin domain-containing protein [Aeropyrum sp.]
MSQNALKLAAIAAALIIVAIAGLMALSMLSTGGEMEEPLEKAVEERGDGATGVDEGEEAQAKAPSFTLMDVRGETISLEDLEGRVVVLWFMIPVGCPICAAQVDDLKKVYEELGGEFVVIAVSPLDYEGVEDDMLEFASRYGVEEWYFAVDRANLTIEYDIVEMGVIVIDPEGREVFRGIPRASYDELKNAIDPLLS